MRYHLLDISELSPLGFAPVADRMRLHGKGDAPPAPDYASAAEKTASGNLDAARLQTKANRINQVTPYGSLTYTHAGDDPDGGWSQNLNLTAAGQGLLDQQNKTSAGLANLQDSAMARVAAGQSQPFDYRSVQDVQDASYGAQTARLDPQWQQNEDRLRAQLANQGIGVGSEAAANEFRNFNQGKNDAYTNARLAAINTAPQTLQMASALRSQPLNELNALRTGSQVQNPTFSSVPQQALTQGANYLGAADMGYNAALDATNASNAGDNALMGGLFSLGGAALGSPWAGTALSGLFKK